MLVLSLLSRMHGYGFRSFACSIWTAVFIVDAIYSFTLRVKDFASMSENLYLHKMPVWGQKPEMPASDASA